MTQDLDIRQFFRRSPRDLLRRYFERNGVLCDLDWSSVRPRTIEALMEAWLALDDDIRGRMVDEFNAIGLLATPVGKVQIIDEALFHGKQKEVAAQLGELRGFYECAFWTFFEHPDCWKGAVSFAEADAKPRGQWRKRINMPRLGRSSTTADGTALGAAIVKLFRQREGRGDYCVVEQYRRGAHGEKEYYFAYPQDHRQMAIEYNKGEMTRRPHRPAFEIIFVLDNQQRTLNIWHQGKRERIVDLQLAFAEAVLGESIGRENPRDDRVYDLDALFDPDFNFHPRPELGIASAEVRKVGIRVVGTEQHTINIHLGAHTPDHVLHHRLKAATDGIPRSMLKVSRIGMRVTFELGTDERNPKTRTFDIVWPNSCSLQNDSRGILIQNMLVDHGIEPRRPAEGKSDGSQGD